MDHILVSVLTEWVDEWIIKENFCPFARPVRVQDSIRIAVCHSSEWSLIYAALRKECQYLLDNPQSSTTLLALPDAVPDFFEYLALLEGAEHLIKQEHWEGVFQLASFHPDYLFEGEPVDSPTHYTNRSPVPLLHILREQEVSRAIPSQQAADDIVIRNQKRLEQIGLTAAHLKLSSWRKQLGTG